MDGVLNINKPPGPTSFGVVAMVRRLSRERHVGHAGTLDPSAGGVLPVCLGHATRLVQFLMESTKVYRAQIELGTATDTYDASGSITSTADASYITRGNLDSVLDRFRGEIKQTPPMFSAVKHHGQPLYKLARAGIQIESKARTAQILRLEVIEFQPPVFTLEVECGKGTYVRSLAHDIGQELGCGAFLKELVRLRCGVFDIKDAVFLADLEYAFKRGAWQNLVHPPETLLNSWNAVTLDKEAEDRMLHGRLLELPAAQAPDGSYCRAYGPGGRFLGLLRLDAESGWWHPEKVFKP